MEKLRIYPFIIQLKENNMKTEIHSNQFMIISMAKGNPPMFSMSANPKIHSSYPEALHEAQRLAGLTKDKKYIVVAVAAVAEMRPVDVPVVTTYQI